MPSAERPLAPGEPAPGIVLPAVNRDGTVALEDCRGKRAVMLGFFRGLHCPFCRRQITQLGAAQPRWPSSTPAELFEAARINPTGELDAPAQPMQANDLLNAKDGFALTAADQRIFAAHATQLTAQFLVDRDGIVRWAWIEAPNAPSELCRFPGFSDMLAAVQTLS